MISVRLRAINGSRVPATSRV
ncbi:hypothetical protein MTR67_002074 [Solanum verrucosum]|uniref:Uncharacterized protein n=1 Tax=Solanum verrucosum TaxID=315347 RepID=A0AAF0PVI0_SOLVR|nr:hypothetical protein MTR67_002074 [Solanum verrucosum]